jgi:hypothetical protein
MRERVGVMVGGVALVFASLGAVEAQSLSGACFALAPLEPEWHPTPEFTDSVPPAPPSADEFFAGVPPTFQLLPRESRGDSSYIAWLEPGAHPHFRGFATWSVPDGLLRLDWWDGFGSHRVRMSPVSPQSDDWVGVFTLRTDVVRVPNRGDWKYRAEIRSIPCPERADGVS